MSQLSSAPASMSTDSPGSACQRRTKQVVEEVSSQSQSAIQRIGAVPDLLVCFCTSVVSETDRQSPNAIHHIWSCVYFRYLTPGAFHPELTAIQPTLA